MDYDKSTDEDENGEDWTDTNWDKCPVMYTSLGSSSLCGNKIKGTQGSMKIEKDGSLITSMQLNDHKAGMQGLNKEHINHIIYEASKGSKFFENERRKEELMKQKIEEQEQHVRMISDLQLHIGKAEADVLVSQLKACRDLTQTIVHVDMDAFYAAVEMLDNPVLRQKPMAVGSTGMLSTSNYEARTYGVRAAMPGFIGKKLCPHLVIVPPNFPRYQEVSNQVREVFSCFDPNFSPMSLDEAYLNITQHLANRQFMTDAERSVVRRSQTPADPRSCLCDLNLTIGNLSVGGQLNSSSHDVRVDEVNKLNECVSHQEYPMSDLKQPNKACSDYSVTATCKEISDTSSSANLEFLASPCVSPPGAHMPPIVASGESDHLHSAKLVMAAAGTQCRFCSKPVPEYEVVTFGKDAESAVQEMRCRIEQRTCLTASAGIAPNMMLAKVCSDMNKPNGQYLLPSDADRVMQFINNLPIRKISGIGRVTEQLLGALGISACHDLYEKRAILYHLHSPVSFAYFMRVACGIGSTQVASAREEERKSISTERTFGEISCPEDLYQKCQELCHSLAEDLAREQMLGKTVSLKLKTTDFQVRTRAQTISNYTRNEDTIFAVAKGILCAELQAEFPKPLCLRLMGVRLSKLLHESEISLEKQDTILDFFKKSASITDQSSPDLANNFIPASIQGSSVSDYFRSVNFLNSLSPIRRTHQVSVAHTQSQNNSTLSQTSSPLVSHNCISNGGNSSARFVKMEETNTENFVTENSMSKETVLSASVNEQTHSSSDKLPFSQRLLAASPVKSETSDLQLSLQNVGPVLHPSASNCCQNATSSEVSLQCTQVRSEVDLQPASTKQNHSDKFVKEPAFICPVCCRAVDCINLTDFNEHIDKCLTSQSGTAAESTASKKQSATTKSAFSTCNKAILDGQKKSIGKTCATTKNTSKITGKMDSNTVSGSMFTPERSFSESASSQDSNHSSSYHADTFLMCPLCGAERADWTLEIFNRHVDACLNRNTISQILREQQRADVNQRKRSIGSEKTAGRSSQQSKKAKIASTDSKAEQSILSFFKS